MRADGRGLYVYDVGTGSQRLVVDQPNMTFSPRFSPNGQYILFSMAVNGNTDIYRVSAAGGTAQRLTTSPGIDTAPSYSPDGSKIVFESDRSGTQQIYVMGADGSNQQRISFVRQWSLCHAGMEPTRGSDRIYEDRWRVFDRNHGAGRRWREDIDWRLAG